MYQGGDLLNVLPLTDNDPICRLLEALARLSLLLELPGEVRAIDLPAKQLPVSDHPIGAVAVAVVFERVFVGEFRVQVQLAEQRFEEYLLGVVLE